MKRLSGLFRSKNPAADRRAPVTDDILSDLEEKAGAAELGFRWIPLNRAGDLCDRAGDRPQALKYYGRAIDAMLEDGQPEPARGLATKIVRIHPEAVRTLCTLTWLDLASYHMASVVVHLNEYVASAIRGEREELAGEQIYMMAYVVADQDFRCAVVDALKVLGHPEDSTEVRNWVAAERAPHDAGNQADWTERCLSHALGSNARRVAQPEAVLADIAKVEEEELTEASDDQEPDPDQVVDGDTDGADDEATDEADEEATDEADEEATEGADEEATEGADEEATEGADEGETEVMEVLREKRDPDTKWI